jgi:hypothetical protein
VFSALTSVLFLYAIIVHFDSIRILHTELRKGETDTLLHDTTPTDNIELLTVGDD